MTVKNSPKHHHESQYPTSSISPLEFNLLGYRTHRHYPCDDFFKIAKDVGNRVIIGTDAHEANALLDMQTYQQAKNHLKDLGFDITEDIRFLR